MATSRTIFTEDFKTTPYWWEAARPDAPADIQVPGETAVGIVGSGYSGLSAALELARDNIRVNALAPGYIMTDLNREFLQSEEGARLAKKVPMRRFATIEELSAALIFLLDPQNSYMTGETLIIDGGMAAGL